MHAAQLPTAEPLVTLEGVSRLFHGVPVVNEVSLAVSKGEFISILGPSGAGKSILLRILAGFEQPDRGRILIDGRDMAGVPPYERDLAMVVQHFALFPHMSVLENVMFGLEMRRMESRGRRQEAAAMLEQVGLQGLESRRIEQLSGGQKQRVALARALVTRPGVLLLDEPLGALDANLRVKMQAELKRLNKRLGITFMLITGNQSEAMAMSDRLVVMNEGRVEQAGAPQEVYRHPRTPFVAGFMGNFNVLSGQVEAVEGRLVRVATAVGPLGALVSDGRLPPVGAKCSCIVRTEAPRLGAGGDEPGNQVSGRVVELEFTGSLLAYLIEVPGAKPFKVEKHRSLERTLAADVGHGDQVTVSWGAAQTQLLWEREGEV
jgi:ABC-type Fe3+/spermidine/putrescine transport system ATPase subunit